MTYVYFSNVLLIFQYNLNGKKLERVLKIMINTNEIPDTSNVKNPECLSAFLNIPELQGY